MSFVQRLIIDDSITLKAPVSVSHIDSNDNSNVSLTINNALKIKNCSNVNNNLHVYSDSSTTYFKSYGSDGIKLFVDDNEILSLRDGNLYPKNGIVYSDGTYQDTLNASSSSSSSSRLTTLSVSGISTFENNITAKQNLSISGDIFVNDVFANDVRGTWKGDPIVAAYNTFPNIVTFGEGSDEIVSETLSVSNDVTFSSNLSVSGTAFATDVNASNVIASNDIVGKTLSVGSDAVLSSNLSVNGAIFTSDIHAANYHGAWNGEPMVSAYGMFPNIVTFGNVQNEIEFASLSVEGNTSIDGSLLVKQDVNIESSLSVNGNIIAGNIIGNWVGSSTGSSTISGDVIMTSLSISSNIHADTIIAKWGGDPLGFSYGEFPNIITFTEGDNTIDFNYKNLNVSGPGNINSTLSVGGYSVLQNVYVGQLDNNSTTNVIIKHSNSQSYALKHTQSGDNTYINSSENIHFQIDGSDVMKINGSNIGIGTSTPLYPLDISSSVDFVFSNQDDIISYGNKQNNDKISIKATDSIWTTNQFIISSDRRIKSNIHDADSKECMNIVHNIPVRIFDYIDKRENKENIYGYIAQEVNSIFPQCVSQQAAYIPSIMTFADCFHHENFTALLFKTKHNLIQYDVIKLFSYKMEYNNVHIFEIIDDKTVHVSKINEYINTCMVYGKLVNDFHTIDYNKVSVLHHGAIQFLQNENNLLKNELREIKQYLKDKHI